MLLPTSPDHAPLLHTRVSLFILEVKRPDDRGHDLSARVRSSYDGDTRAAAATGELINHKGRGGGDL